MKPWTGLTQQLMDIRQLLMNGFLVYLKCYNKEVNMRRFLVILCFILGVSGIGLSTTIVQTDKAQQYLREKYEREAERLTKKANDYTRKAENYAKKGDYRQSRLYTKWANEDLSKAQLRLKWAREARDKARLRMKWADEEMKRHK